MMNRIAKVFGVLATIIVVIVIALGIFQLGGLLVLLFVSAVAGWAVFAVFHYRYVRQEELLHLLGTAAEAGSPIGPAVWAYLNDRLRTARFDHRLERLALLLDSGKPLSAALRETAGVASRETVLATAVGESTGRLALCLRAAPRWRLATVWLEMLPRLLYPLVLLFFINAILIFLSLFIAPKFEKIFADLKQSFPEPTRQVFSLSRSFLAGGGGLFLAVVGGAALCGLVVISTRVRWYFPGLGRLYRLHVQGRVLRMLGILLDANQTLPEALGVLAGSGYFDGLPRRRLEAARRSVEQGEPLGPALAQRGLLPGRMVALVQAAGRAGNLSWALTELGDHLAQRTERGLRRLAAVFFPVSVIATGALVGYIALAYFLPLIKLLTEMSR
jgi:type IV pilus assembly protein PilC